MLKKINVMINDHPSHMFFGTVSKKELVEVQSFSPITKSAKTATRGRVTHKHYRLIESDTNLVLAKYWPTLMNGYLSESAY
jgi:hypothetical protein